MKLKHVFLLILSCIFTTPSVWGTDQIFAESSRLANGKWVKITTAQTGLYEISYQTLRQLGFSNPMKVGVFGHGATQQPENFKDDTSKIIFKDDISQVASAHLSDKLVFYAQGPGIIHFDADRKTFIRDSRNLWSEYGHYFLTECDDILSFDIAETTDIPNNPITEITRGVAYIYHDRDLSLGVNGSGRRFFGEAFNHTAASSQQNTKVKYSWPYSLPDMIPDTDARMNVLFYLQGEKAGVLSFGAENGSKNFILWKEMRKSDYTLEPFISEPTDISLPGNDGSIFISFTPDGRHALNTTFCHLDYWTLTYDCRIPSLSAQSQSAFTIPISATDSPLKITLAKPAHRIIDVSHPELPVISSTDPSGVCIIRPTTANPSYVVFDPEAKLPEPVAYTDIPNQDLHSLNVSDTDFLILTLPEYVDGARRLAEIHKRYDGINTLIAEVSDIYNEFSSGNPDPMAYRAFAKMVYERSGGKLKNILLLGQAAANLKIDAIPGKEPSKMAFYQFGNEAPQTAGSNAIDFYASFDDYTDTSLERRRLVVGIGIVPCSSQAELDNYLTKVERFMADTTYAYRLNRVLYAGGKGDSNMHIRQADEFATRLNALADHAYSFIPISDAYFDPPEARSRFRKEIGQSGFVYFLGHGSTSHIDSRINLVIMSDMYRFNNVNTPFMALCGCDLTNSDRGNRGIAEAMVLTNPNALVAAFTSFRESYATSNSTMLNHMGTAIALTPSDPYHTQTLGEIYLYTKNNTFAQNELTYTIVGDPALKIPAPTNRIHVDSETTLPSSGETLKLSGKITDTSGNILDRFNGEIVARLLSPTATVSLPPDFESKSDTIPYTKYAPPREILTIAAAKVENGLFNISIRIPNEAEAFRGKGLQIACGAFDPGSRAGAGITIDTDFDTSLSSPPKPSDDRNPPEIELFEYNRQTNSLALTVADDEALNLSALPFSNGLTIFLDGKLLPKAYDFPRLIDHDRPAYSTSIPLPALPDGMHQATAEVFDAAGNSVSRSISFFVGPETAATLKLNQEAPYTHASFTLSGAKRPIPENLLLIVINNEGEIVARINCSPDKLEWNLKDSGGIRVPAGLYRVALRDALPSHAPFISSTALVPVLPE